MPTNRSRSERARGCEGFTLIELMVAMVVLTIGLFSIMQLQVVTVRGHAYARERYVATLIAQQVADDMQKEAQEWVEGRTGPVALATVFPNIAPQLVATPAVGAQLAFADLRALRELNGRTIASGDTVANAWRTNSQGFSPDGGGATAAEAEGAIYRVHYVAHYARLSPTAPVDTLIRMTVIVSWDNKDAGQDYNWAQWAVEANFWRRHMVVTTFYFPRRRHF